MNLLDYNRGIHPRCGSVFSFKNDILVTPFYTEEYCREIVSGCKLNPEAFFDTSQINDIYPNYILPLNRVSEIILQHYITQFASKIIPTINSLFLRPSITAIKIPFINRFTTSTQVSMELHCDVSTVSTFIKLNNDFEGGNLNFPRQEFKSQDVPVGFAIIFPGTLTHPHCVEKLTAGERYTMISFATPPPWDSNGVINFN